MKSMEEMIQAAQKAAETIQTQMNEMQAKLDAIEVEGQAGGGLVKVRASAKGRILGVEIDESLMKKCRRYRAGWDCRRDSICRVWVEQNSC